MPAGNHHITRLCGGAGSCSEGAYRRRGVRKWRRWTRVRPRAWMRRPMRRMRRPMRRRVHNICSIVAGSIPRPYTCRNPREPRILRNPYRTFGWNGHYDIYEKPDRYEQECRTNKLHPLRSCDFILQNRTDTDIRIRMPSYR